MKQKINQAVTSSSSGGGGGGGGGSSADKKKKRGGRIIIRLAVAIFAGAPVLLTVLNLELTSKIQSKESAPGVLESSLLNFGGGFSNETQLVSATKDDSQASIYKLIDRSKRIEIPDEDRVLCFVHVGKSGGSTISLLLRNGCIQAAEGGTCEAERWRKFPGQVGANETIASQRIQFYLHTSNVDSGKMAEYYSRVSSIVVVARDPLDRWISAFLSRHPINIDGTRRRNRVARLRAEMKGETPPIWAQKTVYGIDGVRNDQIHRAAYRGCYPNVQEFVNCVSSDEKNLFHTRIEWKKRGSHSEYITLNCSEICKEIAAAKSRYIHHIRVNYEAYLKELPSNKEVFVIRTKSLWDDWVTVNNMLGSPNDVPIPDTINAGKVVNGQSQLPVTSNLNSQGREILCKFLRNEYILYIDLLNRAVNLSDDDMKSTLDDVHKNCPAILESIGENSYKIS